MTDRILSAAREWHDARFACSVHELGLGTTDYRAAIDRLAEAEYQLVLAVRETIPRFDPWKYRPGPEE